MVILVVYDTLHMYMDTSSQQGPGPREPAWSPMHAQTGQNLKQRNHDLEHSGTTGMGME